MTKPKHHQVCKPRYNPGQETRGQSFTEWPLCAHVRASFSSKTPQRRRECGAPKHFGQSQLKHGKKKKKKRICGLTSNYSKLFPVWQPKTWAWKQSWKCPGSVWGYKRVTKPPPIGLPRARIYRLGTDFALAAEVEWSFCRSWGTSPNGPRHKPASAGVTSAHFWGGHNSDPATRAPGCHLCGHGQRKAPAQLPHPWETLPGQLQPWQALGSVGVSRDSGHSAMPGGSSTSCSSAHRAWTHPAAASVLLCHVWPFAQCSEALAHLMQNLLIFVNSKLLWKTFLFSKQCPLLLFFACISPHLPPHPVLVKQGWRYFGHVFTLLMYTCLVSFHFPSDYTLLHKCSHLAQHRSFFLSTPE